MGAAVGATAGGMRGLGERRRGRMVGGTTEVEEGDRRTDGWMVKDVDKNENDGCRGAAANRRWTLWACTAHRSTRICA